MVTLKDNRFANKSAFGISQIIKKFKILKDSNFKAIIVLSYSNKR